MNGSPAPPASLSSQEDGEEMRLRWSEARLQALVTTGSATLYRMSADWRLMYELDSNNFLAKTAEAISDWSDKYILPDDRPMVMRAIEQAIATCSTFDLEHRVALADGGIGWVQSRAVPRTGPDGEIAEWIGGATDITDRKRIEEKLRESENRQAFLLELSDTLRPLADAAEIERRAAEMLGKKLGANRVFYATIESDGDAGIVLRDFTDGMPSAVGRYSLKSFRPSRIPEWRAGRVTRTDDSETDPAFDAVERAAYAAVGTRAAVGVPLVKNGQQVALLAVNQSEPRVWADPEVELIAEVAERTWAAVERARAEAALRESETKFRALFDNMAEGFALFDVVRAPDGQIVDLIYREANKALEHQGGLDRAKTIGQPLTAILPPSDAARFIPVLARAVDPGEPVIVEEYAEVVDRWFEVSAYPHGPDKVAAFYRDISERKRAEESLRVSQEQFEALLNHAPLGVYLVDSDFTIRQVNPVALLVFGDIPGGPVGRDFDEVIHTLWDAAYADELVRIFRHTLDTGESYVTPERAEYRADLHIFEYYEWRLDRIVLPGDRYGVVCYFRDISAQVEARKEIEQGREAARESEERQAFLLQLSDALRPLSDPAEIQTTAMRSLAERLDVIRAGYFELAADQDTFSLTARWERDTDPLPERMLLSGLGADIREAYYAGRTVVIRDTEQDASTAEDLAIFRAIGVKAWIGVPLVKGERLLAAVGVHSRVSRDWTPSELRLVEDVAERTWAAVERARAEQALRESETRFRALATVGFSSVYRMSPDWRELRHLDGAAFLADTHEATVDWVDTYIPPDERPRVRNAINRAIAAKDVFELEHRVLRADNTVGWTFSRAIPLLDDVGEISEWFGAATDVTARVKADQRFTRLFQASPAPFLVLKPDAPHFTIAEVNDAYLSATMRTRDEVVGRGVFEAFPDNPSDETIEGVSTLRASLERVLASRQPDTLPGLKYDVARPDGTFEERWWSPVNSAVLDDDGEVEALIHNANDVTDARRAEVGLRESEERQAFLLKLSDALRREPSAEAMTKRALRMLFEQMRLDRCYVGIYRLAEDISEFPHQVHDDRLLPLPDQMRLSDFPETLQIASNRTLVVDDVVAMNGLSDSDRASFDGLGVRSLINATLRKGENDPLWAVVAASTCPRKWTPGEVLLVEEVAERTWAAVERARAEAALRDREAELARTQRIGQVASVDVALNGSPVGHRSPEYRRLHGLPPDRATESHEQWLERLHPDDRAREDREFSAAIENGDSLDSEYRIIRPSDGEVRWISAKGMIHRDAQGKATRFVGAHIDITELKRVDAAMRASEARLQTLVQGVPQLVWRAVDDGHWTWASPQWTDFTGQREADSHGYGWLDLVHPDDRERVRGVWTGAIKRGEFTADYRLCHIEEQRYRWFQTRATPVRDDTGAVIEWLGTSTDIDDLRDLQDRQLLLVAELQHRVRNILTVVRSVFSRTMDAGGEPEDVADHFRGRLDALARTQVLMTRQAEGSADLEDLIRDELLSVGIGDGPNVIIEGPDVTLPAKVAESIGLAIHELTTNALKYGALKGNGGALDIRWTTNIGYRGARRLVLTWREQGVPALAVKPTRHGFGTELITEALPYRLGAETKLEFLGGGIRCTIDVPMPVSDGAADAV